MAEGLNRDGYRVAAAILGEFVTRREEAEAAVREYEALLARMGERRLDGYIHVKPTHLGLKLDKSFCLENVRALLVAARRQGLFVRMDMEDSPCIDDTLDMYYQLRRDFDNVGVVLQARMRRSLADARELAKVKANVRVCKGIYIEPHAIAYTDPEIINRNFAPGRGTAGRRVVRGDRHPRRAPGVGSDARLIERLGARRAIATSSRCCWASWRRCGRDPRRRPSRCASRSRTDPTGTRIRCAACARIPPSPATC